MYPFSFHKLQLARDADDATEQGHLNSHGVNAIRYLSAMGTVIWGSRTLATDHDPEWRYIPVRRTAMFIEESVSTGTQWAVFESNDTRLWASIRNLVESFLDGLFRNGAFQGERQSDAYFVRCGLGETMTQQDIANRRLVIELGFAPLKPAEFVVLRIQHQLRK